MEPAFEVSPEQQASVGRYMRQQYFYKPFEVRNVSLAGKTAVVTGSNSGIGLESSRQLLRLGLSKLILAVRDEEKGRAAAAELSASLPANHTATIEVWHLDLCVYASVVAFGQRAESLARLDLAVLNAAFCPAARRVNPLTRHDDTIQVNYLSTALLALLLLPTLHATAKRTGRPGRITFTQSEAAAWTKFDIARAAAQGSVLAALDRPHNDTSDHMFASKLLGQSFVRALARRVPAAVVVVNAASPGMVTDSRFDRETGKTWFMKFFRLLVVNRIGNTSAVAARMVVDAAVREDEVGTETHGQFLSMAPIVYTDEGEKVSAQLWKETMDELAFANAEGILDEVSSGAS
ncbi:hypothetical protein B0T26DRAFT_741138 [Lasiosphaeria miniovina]|uniref:Uncharacterized protein n=1 Tax=Lasiosphaeria miniovina TaxID=1954250 RepID=A0AA40ALK1_9PEZI|nr:uncharacterized protein B0T26DRAFT_741138 [Lasiosphaeria miniovina]KAK0718020.1 hypothetical protein B0T26DRAFT_741138 [Lasiosphaeria miniovina]